MCHHIMNYGNITKRTAMENNKNYTREHQLEMPSSFSSCKSNPSHGDVMWVLAWLQCAGCVRTVIMQVCVQLPSTVASPRMACGRGEFVARGVELSVEGGWLPRGRGFRVLFENISTYSKTIERHSCENLLIRRLLADFPPPPLPPSRLQPAQATQPAWNRAKEIMEIQSGASRRPT